MLGVPDYQVEESGPDHQKSFRAVVRIGGRELGSGSGRSKKDAEQQAAEAAWNAITAELSAAAGNGDRPQDPRDDPKDDPQGDEGGQASGPAPGR
jgi:ribonuclease III